MSEQVWTMGERYEVRLSGTGGQGVVLSGIILAEAAGRWDKELYVVQTVSYGPQVRGGLSSAEVVISRAEIDYPKPIGLDLLAPFTQEAANAAAGMMKKGGIILQDPELFQQAPESWVASIPLTALAKKAAGQARMANIVALGAISVLCPYVNPEAMKAAVKERAPEGMADKFVKAMEAGQIEAERIREDIWFEEAPSAED